VADLGRLAKEMKTLRIVALLVALSSPLVAGTKTVTVLGDQKVKTQWDGDMPKAMRAKGIETNVTGIIISYGKLVPTFGFDIAANKKLVQVRVEDVTGKEPIVMVEDFAPAIERAHWKGNGTPREITAEGVPWLFTRGDTLTVFRFTVKLEGDDAPIVIYQPSVFRESSKIRLQNIAAAMKKANQRPERNAGATSPSTSESTPGMAHP